MWGEGKIFGYIPTPELGLHAGNLYNVVLSLLVFLACAYAAWTIFFQVKERKFAFFLASVGIYWLFVSFCNLLSWANLWRNFSWLIFPLKFFSLWPLLLLNYFFLDQIFKGKKFLFLLFTLYGMVSAIYLFSTFVIDGTHSSISYWGVQAKVSYQPFLIYTFALLLPLLLEIGYLIVNEFISAAYEKRKSNFTIYLGSIIFIMLEYLQTEAVEITWPRLLLRLFYILIAFGAYLYFVGRVIEQRFVLREERIVLPRMLRVPFFTKMLLLFALLAVIPIIVSSLLMFVSFSEIINLYIYKPLLWNLKTTREAFLQALVNVQVQALFLTMLIGVLVVIASVIVSRGISESLRRVALGMERLAHGDYSFKVVPNSNDEISDVVNYFNSMSEEIKRARDLLENWNRELEIKVKERTEDLRVLYDVSKAMGSSLDLDLLMKRAIERLMPVIQTSSYALLLPNEKGELKVRICSGCDPKIFEGGKNPPGWTGVSLRAKGEVRGMLMLEIAELDERKSNLLATISDQLAVALENVSVYEKEKEAVARLTELDRLKNEFISMVSHELRTPVTSVDGYVSLFLSGVVGSLNDEQKNYLAIIKENNQRLLTLINRLLDFSKIESGRFELKRELISMHAVIKSAAEIMKTQISRKNATLKLKLDAQHDNFMGDYDKMLEVFVNLIENALKFSKEEETPVIEIATREVENFIEVSVSDNGIGIEKEYLEKIFNKFFQVEETMTRKVGGVGLGLALVKEIIGDHSGKIWAESEGKGKGSRFIFTIPLAEKS